jgi:Arc/MetJ-type ribon-helix-helix transcriptional regulator
MAKVIISLPDAMLRDADRVAKAQHRTRSELFREALRLLLVQRAVDQPSWAETSNAVRARLDGHWRGHWDSTTVIRDDRDAEHGRRARR